ncbi:MAG: homoserine O-succinyltransferase [Dysgonamonadaceae bacterium]|jgi:homoserine O-succinyltransferase|nr:homoserine O-succinyltransferase [Dysgonamonadaceae bacterium]
MIVNLPHNLPAIEILEKENIFPTKTKAPATGVTPLRIALLNLMPLKTVTEADFIRLLSSSPLAAELTFVRLRTHKSRNTPEAHLDTFYKYFDEVCNEHFDGMIITGAPVELLEFQDVTYWEELKDIFNWAADSVHSTLYICWAAQAGLYHFHGINKYPLDRKQFGVFPHTLNNPDVPLFRGFDGEFYIPHSRHTEIRREDILKVPALELLSESESASVYAVMSRGGKEIYLTGHQEYAACALHNEYTRDLAKGLPIDMPVNYYNDNDMKKGVNVRWYAHANILFSNWLNYYLR